MVELELRLGLEMGFGLEMRFGLVGWVDEPSPDLAVDSCPPFSSKAANAFADSVLKFWKDRPGSAWLSGPEFSRDSCSCTTDSCDIEESLFDRRERFASLEESIVELTSSSASRFFRDFGSPTRGVA